MMEDMMNRCEGMMNGCRGMGWWMIIWWVLGFIIAVLVIIWLVKKIRK